MVTRSPRRQRTWRGVERAVDLGRSRRNRPPLAAVLAAVLASAFVASCSANSPESLSASRLSAPDVVEAPSPTCSIGPTSADVVLAMFSDAACTEPLLQDGQPFVVTMDTGLGCYDFTYVDPTGMVVPTSHANFTLSESGISYDKFPFSATCQPSTIRSVPPTYGYTVSNTCQFAPSHRGGVYEKLVDYTYPETTNCTVAP